MSLDLAAGITDYLASKGYQPKKAAGSEVRYPCFFACNESPNSRKRKLYVNTAEGFYHCKVCDEKGGTTLLKRHFGDDDKDDVLSGPSAGERYRILDEAAALGERWLQHDDDTLLYLLNERGLSVETILARRIGRVRKRQSLAGSIQAKAEDMAGTGLVFRDGPRAGQDFFYDHILIPYISRGHVVQMRGKVPGGKYMTGPGEGVRLYGTDSLDDAEDVVITEGEFDTMVLQQNLETAALDRARRIAVVGLAGTGAMPANLEDYFSEARRVFIGLDPDDPGKRAAVKLKEMLGARARILELPEELPKCDWTEYLLPVPADASDEWHDRHPHAGHTWRDVMSLMGNATGKRLFTVSEAAHRWRNQETTGGLRTGWPQLDLTIQPGIKPGQLFVVLAKTGTGKTIFLCNFAYNTRDVPTLFISLEQTQEEVYERLRRIHLFYNPRDSDSQVDAAYSKLMICEENRLSEKDLALLVEEYEIEMGEAPQLIVVDYLGYYARGMDGRSPYEKVSNAVMQLKAEAKKYRCQVVTPHQVSRLAKEGKPIDLDDARDSGVVEETADFLGSIWRPDDALRDESQQPTGKLKFSLLKSRHGGKDRTFTWVMDLLTLAIVEDVGEHAKRARDHNYLSWRGETYADLRKKETVPLQGDLMTEERYR